MGANAFVDLIGRTQTPLLRLRNEDFFDEPATAVTRVTAFIGRTATTPPLKTAQALALPRGHEVSGNQLRLTTAAVQLRRNDAWSHMTAADRRLVSLLITPGLWRYGYPPPGDWVAAAPG